MIFVFVRNFVILRWMFFFNGRKVSVYILRCLSGMVGEFLLLC